MSLHAWAPSSSRKATCHQLLGASNGVRIAGWCCPGSPLRGPELGGRCRRVSGRRIGWRSSGVPAVKLGVAALEIGVAPRGPRRRGLSPSGLPRAEGGGQAHHGRRRQPATTGDVTGIRLWPPSTELAAGGRSGIRLSPIWRAADNPGRKEGSYEIPRRSSHGCGHRRALSPRSHPCRGAVDQPSTPGTPRLPDGKPPRRSRARTADGGNLICRAVWRGARAPVTAQHRAGSQTRRHPAVGRGALPGASARLAERQPAGHGASPSACVPQFFQPDAVRPDAGAHRDAKSR